ncbi:MAG: helix-turn-helix domain-containing protein [Actinomycetota bacterium]
MDMSVSGVGVIDKSVTVLAALDDGPASLAELVERTGLARPTAHRLATALEVHGLVGRDRDGRFRLGARLVGLGRRAAEALPLAELALPVLRRLRDETGESAQLYVREGVRRVCVASLDSPEELRTIVAPGASLPLEVGSAGHVLSDADGGVGWRASVAERAAGVASVSAGVVGGDGEVVAAVSVSGPIDRLGEEPGERYGEVVRVAADDVAAMLA